MRLGLNTFLVITKNVYTVSFLAGQALGYFGSWSLFALFMWLAAQMAYPFSDYAILGDDVLITDDKVAVEYQMSFTI